MIVALPSFSWFFLFAFALNGLIAISILIFKNKTFRTANLLLAINLLGISLASIMISLVESRLILEIPHFYRTPSPIYYLMFPAGYLYVKLILSDRNRLERKEYLHFLPALIHLVEMMPYYLSSVEKKLDTLHLAFDQNIQQFALSDGWLPAYAHNIIRGAFAVIYGVAMWRLIRKSTLNNSIANRYAETIIRWLKTFTIINIISGAGIVLLLVSVFIPADIRSLALHLIFLTLMLIANFYLFFRPEILYGLPQSTLAYHSTSATSEKLLFNELNGIIVSEESKSEIPSFIYHYKNQVHQYLLESKRYLEPDFSLHDLARDTNIPKHHIQLLIHKVEDKKFSEFITDYRIQHLQDQIEKGSMKNKTLEGLATESGFSSKASFIRSVKKRTGKTPKEYFIQGNFSL